MKSNFEIRVAKTRARKNIITVFLIKHLNLLERFFTGKKEKIVQIYPVTIK